MHCRIRGRHDTFSTRQGLRSGPQHHQGHMERSNGVFEWSSTFNSPLEMNKLALVNFAQSATKSPTSPSSNGPKARSAYTTSKPAQTQNFSASYSTQSSTGT